MGYKAKPCRKFMATAVTATIVASAIAPVASAATVADFTDVAPQYQEAVSFLLEKGATNGKTETQFGVYDSITRQDAATQLVNVLGLEVDTTVTKTKFTDVPARTAPYVQALVDAGITNGKTETQFGANEEITRGQLAVWIQKGFELESSNSVDFTDVASHYQEAVSALVSHGVTNGISETQFGTYKNAQRGDYAIFLMRAAEASTKVKYEVKSTAVDVTTTDENVLNTLFNETVLDFGSANVTVTDVDFTSDNEELISDNDAIKEGTVAISAKYNGQTSIYVNNVTVTMNDTNETVVLNLNDLKIDVNVKAQDSTYMKIGVDRTKVLDYISINMNFQNSFDQKVTGLEVSLLNPEGKVVATSKATAHGLNKYVNSAAQNNSSLTTTFWEQPKLSLSWNTKYYGSLKEAVAVQVTFTANDASYTISESYRQAPVYEVKTNEVELTTADENALNTLFDGTVLDFGSANVTVTDVDFTSDNEELIVDNDATKEGTVVINPQPSAQTSIYVDTVTVQADDTNETFVFDLKDLQVDVTLAEDIDVLKYQVESGATVALEDILGDILTQAPNYINSITINIPTDSTVTWETGAAHGSTPLLPEDATVQTVVLNGGTFKATGAGVGPIRAANEGGKLVFENMTIIDESKSYAENNWEYGYLEFAGEVEFVNSNFKNAIMIEGDKASFTDCSFNSNKIGEYAAWISNGIASFDKCTFKGSRGIKIHEAYGTDVTSVTIDNSTFESLYLKPGLAIGNLDETTTVIIKNSTFNKTRPGAQSNYIYESDTPVDTFNFIEENNTVIK